MTVASTLVYAIIRTLGLQKPLNSSRLLVPAVAVVCFIVLSHFTLLLSYPLGQFPYGYHTKFVVCLGLAHHLLWILWSLSFLYPYPKIHLAGRTFIYPQPYPPNDPLQVRSTNAMTPLSLVVLTTVAMSFELFDFRPVLRIIDAHGLWHAFTIPLAMGWWSFFTQDAIDLESAALGSRPSGSSTVAEKMPLSGPAPATPRSESTATLRTPTMPAYAQFASTAPPPSSRSPARSPGKAERQD